MNPACFRPRLRISPATSLRPTSTWTMRSGVSACTFTERTGRAASVHRHNTRAWRLRGRPAVRGRQRVARQALFPRLLLERRHEEGPRLFSSYMRHAALKLDGDMLSVFYTNVGEAPERILLSRIVLGADWQDWREGAPIVILRPEEPFEGADCALEPSVRGLVHGRVRQLRDPAIFREGGRTYLLYAIAGESGIAIAELFESD